MNALAPEGFAIGTVAGLTGLDPHTIRAWERRHRAVEPQRSDRGTRRYSDGDVLRLQLLKALVDAGESIGRVAPLSDDELRDRIAALAEMTLVEGDERAASAATAKAGLALLAPGLATQLAADPASGARVDVVVACDDLVSFLTELRIERPDVVVVELERLGAEPLHALQEIRKAAEGCLVVLLYQFATASDLARLSRGGARLIRSPIRAAELSRAIADYRGLERASFAALQAPVELGAAAQPPRLFDDEQLARLLELPGSVTCECPGHLASLVSSVLSFERYSAACESRNEHDALLHRRLATTSSRIRAEFEQLLQQVCRHDGLDI